MGVRLVDWLIGSRRRAWVSSLAVGIVAAPLTLYGGLLGLLALGWLVVALWYGRSRLVVLSGLLTGFGALWLMLVIFGAVDARTAEAPLALAVGAISVALGLGIGALAPGSDRAQRGARPTLGRDDSVSYFRDLSGRASAPGVREEDEPPRWRSGTD